MATRGKGDRLSHHSSPMPTRRVRDRNLKSPAWVEQEVDAHLLSLIARRDAGGAK